METAPPKRDPLFLLGGNRTVFDQRPQRRREGHPIGEWNERSDARSDFPLGHFPVVPNAVHQPGRKRPCRINLISGGGAEERLCR